MRAREYTFWFVFRRAKDVPGEWVGHCLDLDVVTQGTSLQHTMRMLGEACAMIVCDDVQAGRDPLDRRAPQAHWDCMFNMVAHGQTVDFRSLDEKAVGFLACNVLCRCRLAQAAETIQESVQTEPDLAVPLTLVGSDSAHAPSCQC
jgi:hypothetical protein